MNTLNTKTAGRWAASVLMTLSIPCLADSWTDQLLTPNATDLYQVICSNSTFGTPTDHFAAAIRDERPPKKNSNRIILQVIKVGGGAGAAASTSDPKDGNRKFGPFAEIAGGNGTYYVTVTKSLAGPERYTLDMHCESSDASGGEHTGTSFKQLQDDNPL